MGMLTVNEFPHLNDVKMATLYHNELDEAIYYQAESLGYERNESNTHLYLPIYLKYIQVCLIKSC